jgi:hypothetical protein
MRDTRKAQKILAGKFLENDHSDDQEGDAGML